MIQVEHNENQFTGNDTSGFGCTDEEAEVDLSQVTLSQMRYAIAVADTRSFRAAAERSFVSQSGLSMQVQRLEELLDCVLFDRSRKPVMETLEGSLAIGQMRRVLQEVERLGQIVAEEREPSGRFRLGVIPTMSSTVLPLFLRRFMDDNPRVELSIEELKTESIIARLREDTLDAGLLATPLEEAGLQEEALAMERLYAYLPPDDGLLASAEIGVDALDEHELWLMPEGHCFRTQVLAYCGAERSRRPARVHFESGSFDTLIHLVDGGLGATVLPELVVLGLGESSRARVRPFCSPAPAREIGLVTARADLRRRVREALSLSIREGLGSVLSGSVGGLRLRPWV